ncbi:MAG: hypothetical protein H6716_29755, partial [Polyangiaceae bacterium]|nr:hypothetical protein [Polyangiaceae bacterium]
MNISGTLIFAVTYFLISARRLSWLGLDRPAGALLGAVASVAFGALSPEAAINAIQGPTILLLFGVMGMGAFLALDGFFDHIERIVMRHAATRARLLALVVWGAGTLAAFITNDAVCLLGAPILVRLIERHRLPPLPFLLALATAANIGSVATLVGNPQNMLCAELGHLSYRAHLSLVGPLAVLCLGVNHSLLYAMFRRVLRNGPLAPLEQAPKNAPEPPSSVPRLFLTVAVVLATAIAYTLGANLA